jgi:hypothetical protein
VAAFFLHLGRRPAKNAAQHFAKSFCSVAPSVFGPALAHQAKIIAAKKKLQELEDSQ